MSDTNKAGVDAPTEIWWNPSGHWSMYDDSAIRDKPSVRYVRADLSTALQQVRDAEWNAAIEAAKEACNQIADELCQARDYAAGGAFDALDAIRALRRTPHGGRGMSAPRKIWVTEYHEVGAKGAGHWIDHNFSVDAKPYHRDDVVRELVEVLMLHAAYESTPSDRGGKNGPKGEAYAAFISARDAALAKTAQEGKP